ncbi:hypothetical protein A0H81_14724 [Grifola frondosa]|uniref:HNH nuclease domain-containing protein n=1 Tax=Grifola frondosa TaxID=5627 RepID=A0A1C7LMZ7_GRIFR|nr:hypothetical protein A0H81_14724 [Grifola frondosa]
MPGKPLPPNPYSGIEKVAYNTCLYLESLPGWNVETPAETPQLCGRLLGYMILEAPTPEGRRNVATEIQACASASDALDRLASLAQFYEVHFLRSFKAAKDRTPPASTRASPPFNMTTYEKGGSSEPQGGEEALLLLQSHKCLVRDDYRCVITGRYDYATFDSMIEDDETFVPPSRVDATELAHIVIESTNDDDPKHSCAVPAWTALERFGMANIEDGQMNGEGMHRLQNVMTMCPLGRCCFDALKLWLEEIGANRYRICVTHKGYLLPLGIDPDDPVIELTTTDADLPLPDPDLLRLHATCAKVAHLSGVGEIIDALLRDIEDLKTLANDGSSADVLTAALLHSGRNFRPFR